MVNPVLIVFDDGAPQYDPNTQRAECSWIDAVQPASADGEPDRLIRTAVYQIVDLPIADVKTIAKADLDRASMAVRERYWTPGKDGVYAQKQREALAVLDDPSPSGTTTHPVSGAQIPKYQHLRAMVGTWVKSTGNMDADLLSAATMVLGKAEDLKAISAEIERILDAAKVEISAATTAQQVRAAVAGVQWP